MGDSSASITTPRHQAVVNRLRERIEQYRKHDQTCRAKYEVSLPLRQAQDHQDAVRLHQRALEGRTKMMHNMKAKQQEPGTKTSKQDQPPNGLEKSPSTASAILQQQILKRKLDQSLNSSSQSAGHSLEPNEQGDCLTKYQRGLIQEDVHSLVSEQQINMQSAQQGERYTTGAPHDQLQHAELRSHQLASEDVSNPRHSPLITNSADHNPVDAFQGNRIASPSSNAFQGAEFKQESQVAVSCEGGHAGNSNSLHETMSASEPLAHSTVELRATNSLSFSEGNNDSQHLKEQLDDFERILQNYQKSEGTKRTNNGQSSGLDSQQPQQQQLQTPILKQSDPMSRSPSQEQVNDRNSHVSPNNSLPSVPYHQPGSLQLQEIARQSAQLAQANQVRPQHRIALNRLHQLQLERIKQAANHSAQQQQQQHNAGTQPQQASVPSYFQSQFPQNQYRPGFEDQNQTATHVSSSYSAVNYQRTLQAQQASQQGLYGFPGQHQNVVQKLTHQTMQEKSQVYAQQRNNRQLIIQQQQQQQQGQLTGYDTVPQNRNVPMQELSVPYSMGMRLANQSSPAYQRQHSMPHISSHAYPQQNFYQPAAYQAKDQAATLLQQAKQQQVPQYNNLYQRRHSFPFNRSISQPAEGFSVGMQDGYSPVGHVNPQSRGQPFLPQNVLEGRVTMTQSSLVTQNKPVFTGVRPMHTPTSYPITPGRMLQSAPNQTAPKNHYNLSHMSSSQATRNYAVDGGNADYNRIQRENSFGGYQPPDVPVTSSDSQFSPFPSPRTLEKAPSFTSLLSQANPGELGSLLDQASANPGNLETTFSGSMPNLDLLGEILGQ